MIERRRVLDLFSIISTDVTLILEFPSTMKKKYTRMTIVWVSTKRSTGGPLFHDSLVLYNIGAGLFYSRLQGVFRGNSCDTKSVI